MEIRGRIVVITVFALGLAMSGAAWWHNYSESDQSAQFWGKDDATLLLRSPTIELIWLAGQGQTDDEAASGANDRQSSANPTERLGPWRAFQRRDFSEAHGLVHFRHALTFDANYQWPPQVAQADQFDAVYALRLADDQRQLVLVFPQDFSEMGRLESDQTRVTVLRCPKMAPALVQYLREIGVLDVTDEN